MDREIFKALYKAARDDSVDTCRILWAQLSRRGQRKYSNRTRVDDNTIGPLHVAVMIGPLHVAVMYGHFEVVRLFIQEFKWNIHQKNTNDDKTPLCSAVRHLEIARFLLENGANVNLGGSFGPIWFAVRANNTDVVRLLLLEYRANPNLNRRTAVDQAPHPWYNVDQAIMNGNEEILRMLLEHGAFIGQRIDGRLGSSLIVLLRREDITRESKLVICRILTEHANQGDHATAAFIQASFKFAVKVNHNEGCQILLEAGIDPRMSMYCAIRANNNTLCQLLVGEYQVDPFLEEEESDDIDDNNENVTTASPFLAAARLADTTLLEYFLGIWNERFASTVGNKNNDGDYPLHVVCCDPFVSLETIKLLVNHHADVLAMVDGQQGLLPFHFAANWGASLDVIFYMLQHCPNALRHGNAVAAAAMIETKDNDDAQQDASRGPPKKKAKMSHTGH